MRCRGESPSRSGGYSWAHGSRIQVADTFPWIAAYLTGPQAQRSDLLTAELTAALDLPGYIRDRYASAVAEVELAEGVTEHERRMRVMCYLHYCRGSSGSSWTAKTG